MVDELGQYRGIPRVVEGVRQMEVDPLTSTRFFRRVARQYDAGQTTADLFLLAKAVYYASHDHFQAGLEGPIKIPTLSVIDQICEQRGMTPDQIAAL